jgi:hypothetical protein
MTGDTDEPREGDPEDDGKDEIDPSDWLAKQFGTDDEPERPKPKSAFPGPPILSDPLAAPPAPGSPSFSWGLKPGADTPAASDPPTEPTVPPVAPVPLDSLQAPAEPTAADPLGALIASGVPSAPADPPPPTVALPVESPATELLDAGDAEVARPEAASTIDSLFGEKQFKDYEDEPLIGAIPSRTVKNADVTRSPRSPRAQSAPLPRNQKILLWIAGGAVAVLALVVLFLVGTKIPDVLGPAPAVAISKTPSPTPSVTPTSPAVGPVAVGEHKWNALLGGECLDPFPSPWAEKFTVVDCAAPHPAQMVFRGTFPDAPPAAGGTPAPSATPAPGAYPGAPALQAQINLLCTAPGVIDLATAGAYSDIQFQAAYPVTEKEWADGYHDYFCFVSRSSGGPITGSLATPHPAG